MNALSKIIATCFCALAVVGANAQKGDWASLSHFAADNERVKQLPQEDRRIVFLGNSIIELWAKFHPNFFTDNKYIPRGISGQTSYQYIVRLREDVIDLHPKYVIMCAPVNDIAENTYPYNEDRTMGNIMTICELLKAHKIKVILGSGLPSTSFPWDPSVTDVSRKIQSLNARVKAYAEKNHMIYADYYPLLEEGNTGEQKKAYTGDGVHPSREGYTVMENYIQTIIKKLK